jgi:phage/plasmid-associated DNA primase
MDQLTPPNDTADATISATDINSRKMFLTVFKDEKAAELFHGEYTLPEWRDQILAANATAKDKLFWLKGARFGNIKSKKKSLRTNLNVQHLTAIVVEHDAGTVSFDEALTILAKAGVRALIYTSPSHSAEKQRWRVILPLSYDAAKTRHDILVATVNGMFSGALSSESFVLSQSYYFGSVDHNPEHRCEIVDGEFLDVANRLYAGSIFQDGSRVGDDSPMQRVRDEANNNDRHDGANSFSRAGHGVPDDPAKVTFALNQISSDIPYYTKDGGPGWMTMGAAVASEVEYDEGFKIFDAWSKTSTRYNATTISERWDAFCEMSFISIGTLYHFADQANPGWRKEWKAKVAAGNEEQEDAQPKQPDADWSDAKQFDGWLNKGVEALPDGISARCKIIVAFSGTIENLNTDLERSIGKKPKDKIVSLDEIVVALAIELLGFDLPVEQVAAGLLCDLKCNAPITKLPTEAQQRNAADRAIYIARQKIAATQHTDGKPDDRGAGDNSGAKLHAKLTKLFLEHQRAEGEVLRIVADEKGVEAPWRCGKNNLWEPVISINGKIDGCVERIARNIGVVTDNELMRQTREYILRDPAVRPAEDSIRIEWDAHGKIAVRDKLIDPRTGATEPLRKDHYATQSMDFDYDPDAKCPLTVQAFDDLFADRAPALRAKTIALMQEVGGMGLIIEKGNKALSKVLIFQGPSNSGKSTGGETLIGMYPGKKIATSLEAISGPHGLEEFAFSNGCWALHEAFNKNVWIPPQILKTIISGEPVGINIKNGRLVTKCLKNPIVWMTNPPVQISEESAAIKNRLIVMMTRVVFDENKLIGVGAIAREHGYDKVDQFLLATERPGIFNWMLAGAQRAMKRGFFENTEEGEAALDDVQTAGNVVGAFLEECVIFGPTFMVSVADFCAAFKAHWEQSQSNKKGTPANDSVSRALLSKGDPCIGVSAKDLRDKLGRYYAGMHLNTDGLDYWEAAATDQYGRALVRTSEHRIIVNKTIPDSWQKRPAVKRVMEADFSKHDQERAEADSGPDYRTDEEREKAKPRF